MTFIPERMENLSAVSGWNDPGFFFFFFGRAVYTLISKLISLNLGGRQKKKKNSVHAWILPRIVGLLCSYLLVVK